jgi:hypothetical protein
MLAPTANPPGRTEAALAYDPTAGGLVLFGGFGPAGSPFDLFGDTWIWDGTDWIKSAPLMSPSPRLGPVAAYDEGHDQLILFGGYDFAEDAARRETWTYRPVGPPTAAIDTPGYGSSYTVGQTVPTAFHCTEAAEGPGVETCEDSNGADAGTGSLDTSTVGTHTYTVTATSEDGLLATSSIGYTVVAPVPVTSQNPTPPGRAGGWFGIRTIGRDLERGAASLGVDFTGSGTVTLTGAGIATTVKSVSSGTTVLPIVPIDSLKAKLARTGKVKVTVTFKTDGNVWRKNKSLVLRLGTSPALGD